MNEHEILHELNELQQVVGAVDEQFDVLATLFDIAHSPLTDSVYMLIDSHIESIASRINCNALLLGDWWLTHQWGEKPMMASVGDNPLKPVSSNTELASFILEVSSEP